MRSGWSGENFRGGGGFGSRARSNWLLIAIVRAFGASRTRVPSCSAHVRLRSSGCALAYASGTSISGKPAEP